MAKSHTENVVINISAGFALRLVSLVMNLILKRVFIYTLGIQYTGVSTLFVDILNMLSLAEMGIGSAITFSLYRPIRENDYRRIAALMNFYRRAYRLIAGFVLVAGMACVPFLPFLVKNVPDIRESISLIFVLYVINNATSYLRIYKSTLLTASERGYMISRVTIWFALARTALECVLLMVFKNFILYLLVGIAEALIRNLVISRQAGKLYPQIAEYSNERLTKDETKKLRGDVSALALYRVCQVMLGSTDSIIISAAPALGVVSVGFLGNYRLLFSTVMQLIRQFFVSFTPSLGSMATEAGPEKQHEVFKTTNFVSFWAMCFCCTSLICLAAPFVRIWLGGDYVLPIGILITLTLNFYLTAMSRATNAFRDGNGLFVQGKYRPLAMAVINIGMDILLVGPLGVLGVLLATSIARLSTQCWYDPWLVYRRVFKRPVREYFITTLKYTLIVAASCAITYYLCRQVGGLVNRLYLGFLIRMALCLIIPNALVVLLYRKTPEYEGFVKRLSGTLKKLRRRLGRKKM